MFSHLFHSENLATAFILLNRLTSISFPFSHERIWRQWLFPLAVMTTLLIPLPLFTWRVFARQYRINVNAAGDDGPETFTSITNITGVADPSAFGNDSYYSALSAFIFLGVCAVINIATVVVYRCVSSKFPADASITNNRATERRLTIYAVLTFFAQLAMAMLMAFIYYGSAIPLLVQNLADWDGEALFFASFNQYPLVNVRARGLWRGLEARSG